jgi:hypothetical protein
VVEAHGDVGMSGGYGLWGSVNGTTIYPDLQPTVDDLRKRPSPEAQVFPGEGYPTPSAYPRTEEYQQYLNGERMEAPSLLNQGSEVSVIPQPADSGLEDASREILPLTLDSSDKTTLVVPVAPVDVDDEMNRQTSYLPNQQTVRQASRTVPSSDLGSDPYSTLD